MACTLVAALLCVCVCVRVRVRVCACVRVCVRVCGAGVRRCNGAEHDNADDQRSDNKSRSAAVLVDWRIQQHSTCWPSNRVQFRLGAHIATPLTPPTIHCGAGRCFLVNECSCSCCCFINVVSGIFRIYQRQPTLAPFSPLPSCPLSFTPISSRSLSGVVPLKFI